MPPGTAAQHARDSGGHGAATQQPAGLAGSTIRNDTNHLDLIRDKAAIS
jgi:hypothetical protein